MYALYSLLYLNIIIALQSKSMKNCQFARHPIRILEDQMQDYFPIGITYINTFQRRRKIEIKCCSLKYLLRFFLPACSCFSPFKCWIWCPKQKVPDFNFWSIYTTSLGLGHILNHPLGINSLLTSGIAVKTNLCYYLILEY